MAPLKSWTTTVSIWTKLVSSSDAWGACSLHLVTRNWSVKGPRTPNVCFLPLKGFRCEIQSHIISYYYPYLWPNCDCTLDPRALPPSLRTQTFQSSSTCLPFRSRPSPRPRGSLLLLHPSWSASLMTSHATQQVLPVLLTLGWGVPRPTCLFSGAPGTDLCTWGPSLPLGSLCLWACGLIAHCTGAASVGWTNGHLQL